MAQTKPLRISVSSQSAKAIKLLREKKGWTQSELAKKAGVPRARIKRLECNELKTILSSEYTAIWRKLGVTLLKSKPSPQKTVAKTVEKIVAKASKQKRLPRRTPTGKISRNVLVKKLDEAGYLDLTLRELLAS